MLMGWNIRAAITAEADHVIEFFLGQIIDGLGPLFGDVDAKLLHDRNRFVGNITERIGTGAVDLDVVASRLSGEVTEPAFGYL